MSKFEPKIKKGEKAVTLTAMERHTLIEVAKYLINLKHPDEAKILQKLADRGA